MAAIPQNVVEFLRTAEDAYGRYQAESFGQFMWGECSRIESPIEQLFLIAIYLVAETNCVEFDTGCHDKFDNDNDRLVAIPQWRAGKYRVDFALRQHPIDRIVCVELDGHEFHDRNERQRRYEKTRDRFLTATGYSVLHFTGSEIFKDPCAAALEAFNLATGLSKVSTHPFEDQ